MTNSRQSAYNKKMTIINGNKIAQEILAEQKRIINQNKLKPKLAAVLIGDDEASRIYVNEKRKKSKKIGIDFKLFDLPTAVKQAKVIDLLKKLNDDKTVSGIIVQFPLPKTFDADAIVKTIDPKKDADGFHPENIKKFLELDDLSDLLDKNLLLPVTAAAIMEILNVIAKRNDNTRKQIQRIKNKKIAVIGKSSIFLIPLIHFFGQQIAVINPNDPSLADKSSQADILITACGKPSFIKSNMIKPGAIVIDVGISRFDSPNRLVAGDVDFDAVAPKTSFITPVPGGVGPVTVAILLRNVVLSALLEKKS